MIMKRSLSLSWLDATLLKLLKAIKAISCQLISGIQTTTVRKDKLKNRSLLRDKTWLNLVEVLILSFPSWVKTLLIRMAPNCSIKPYCWVLPICSTVTQNAKAHYLPHSKKTDPIPCLSVSETSSKSSETSSSKLEKSRTAESKDPSHTKSKTLTITLTQRKTPSLRNSATSPLTNSNLWLKSTTKRLCVESSGSFNYSAKTTMCKWKISSKSRLMMTMWRKLTRSISLIRVLFCWENCSRWWMTK